MVEGKAASALTQGPSASNRLIHRAAGGRIPAQLRSRPAACGRHCHCPWHLQVPTHTSSFRGLNRWSEWSTNAAALREAAGRPGGFNQSLGATGNYPSR